jgi:hypothetical protein
MPHQPCDYTRLCVLECLNGPIVSLFSQTQNFANIILAAMTARHGGSWGWFIILYILFWKWLQSVIHGKYPCYKFYVLIRNEFDRLYWHYCVLCLIKPDFCALQFDWSNCRHDTGKSNPPLLIVFPLMLAVLPYANSRYRLLFIVWTYLCFSPFISLYIVQATSIWPHCHAKRFGWLHM